MYHLATVHSAQSDGQTDRQDGNMMPIADCTR